ncbi:MAG: 2-keto-3-deoxygluconate permease [Advenella sp.]
MSVGSQISFRSALPSVEKGIVLLVAKFGIAVIFGLSVAFFAPDGVLFGLLPLAIIAGMSNSNGSLYVELPPKNWTPIQLLKVSSEHGNEFKSVMDILHFFRHPDKLRLYLTTVVYSVLMTFLMMYESALLGSIYPKNGLVL